jgi:hypothetical protein
VGALYLAFGSPVGVVPLVYFDSTDWGGLEPAVGFPASASDFHDFAYAYTVGASSSG